MRFSQIPGRYQTWVVDKVHALGLDWPLRGPRFLYLCLPRRVEDTTNIHAKQFHEWQIDYLKYDSCWRRI